MPWMKDSKALGSQGACGGRGEAASCTPSPHSPPASFPLLATLPWLPNLPLGPLSSPWCSSVQNLFPPSLSLANDLSSFEILLELCCFCVVPPRRTSHAPTGPLLTSVVRIENRHPHGCPFTLTGAEPATSVCHSLPPTTF